MNSAARCESNRETPLTGTVIAAQANYYFVRLTSGEQMLCLRRSLLKKIGQQVMVGDRVGIEQPDWQSMRGAICRVYERDSLLDRPPVANADQILLVFAVAQPYLDPLQLSRFLVTAEQTGIDLLLCLSKCDLIDGEEQAEWVERLTDWGYPPLLISAQNSLGMDVLIERLQGRVTVVSGPSGVGKSSLINQLIPQVQLRVSEVSGKLERGRHTTRHVELFELAEGGLLADTPGFNQPDLTAQPEAIAQYFPEVVQRLGNCQFGDCLHREEPGCGVQGEWERYDFYRLFLEEAIDRAKSESHQATPDAAMKQKSNSSGVISYEPRLDAKYRKKSRKTEEQTIKNLKGKLTDFMVEED
jgi:ribosome biogenesis GTPase / thiamine phosphate phosphatase